jgi:predicted DCC family thiol-disulfide oxidoreductase YuxK
MSLLKIVEPVMVRSVHAMPKYEGSSSIVIFDGTCGFCSRAVLFVLRYDARGELLFAANRSPFGAEVLARHGLLEESNHTIVVVDGARVLLRSDAALFIASHLRSPYSWLVMARFVPRFVRDLAYRMIASIRHRLVGAQDVCELLPPEHQARIIDA